jgi:hypothetical protein
MVGRILLCRAALLVAILQFSAAQEPTGAIVGSITDPSGASVPRAKVVVEDARTSRASSVQTGDSGQFTFPALAAGAYIVRVEADGFAPWQAPVTVEIDRTVRVPVDLSIRGQQRVDISASAPTVETAATSLGQTVSQQQILDLHNWVCCRPELCP